MWWLICLTAIIVGVCIAIFYDEDFGLGIITVVLFGILILFVIRLCYIDIVEEYEIEQYKIQGLENNITTNQSTNGAFILGFGYVNSQTKEEMKYYYFKVNDIGKKLETIEISNNSDTYIRETDEIEPCLIYRYQKTENKGFFKWLFGKCENETKIAEILVVPSNTIKIEYNVDIKG